MKDLRERTIRGGWARLGAQAANFVLRIGSLMVLSRILEPRDFGLVAMVTAFTGVLSLFRDFGLSAAAVQRGSVSAEQASTLFWINVLVGMILGGLTVVAAPILAAFYREPRLIAVTSALALGFIFNAAGIQHGVMLQRELRFSALAAINTAGLVISIVVGVAGALWGYGYWSLVFMTVVQPLINTLGCWWVTSWLPGRPQRQEGMASLLRFGSTVTLNSLVYYAGCNFDKVLLGRVWGVDALGMYGRAFQLLSIPTDNVNAAAGDVAFAALSRLKDDPARFRRCFLKGYALTLAITVPATFVFGLFADDVTAVFLGPKWDAAVGILRLLTPAILAFAILNPLGWLLTALGLVRRGLNIAVVIAPLLVVAYLGGLSHGPEGVALAYSMVMLLWVLPAAAWAVSGTPISLSDLVAVVSRPLAASIAGGVLAIGARLGGGELLSPFLRLALESAVLLLTFSGILLFALGQKTLYVDLLRGSSWWPVAAKDEVTTSLAT